MTVYLIPSKQALDIVIYIAVVAILLRIILTIIYRVYFHPLARFPGPWVAKVTDLYPAYYNILGRLHIETERGHKIYGPIFRQGPNKLVTNSVNALHEIYHSKGVQKSVAYATMVPAPGAFNVFTAIDKDMHRFKRRVLSHGFADRRIRDFEPRIIEHAHTFLKMLVPDDSSTEWSSSKNMTEMCRHYSYDIMGEFGFGQSFKLQESNENRFLIDAVTATINKAGAYVLYPGLQRLHLDLLFYYSGMKMRQKYLNLMGNLVKARLAMEKNERQDLFSYLVDAKDEETGKGFTETELWAESRFLLIAGADTTSTAMSALFFYLAAYPECFQKLAKEIRTAFRSAEEIRLGTSLSSCLYLRACIDEAMRMSPPISSSLWREVTADKFVVDGHHIPKGSDIAVSPYAFHHNESNFPNSFEFIPERWIPSLDNPEERIEALHHMYSVFSIGTRACAGKTMAYAELSILIAYVVWYFDLASSDGTPEGLGGGYVGASYGRHREKEFQLQEHLTCHHDGPYLIFRVRRGAEAEVQRMLLAD